MNLTLALLLHLAAGAWAQTPALAQADADFEKGRYQEALQGYESKLKDPDLETRLKALYRACEAQALLLRYLEAAERCLKAPLPADALWKGRFLILRAELAREFLKQYAHGAPEDREESAADMARRTPEEWRAETDKAYRALWDLRGRLSQRPLAEEGYFVDLKNADTEEMPSLWDFAVLRWSGYLLGEIPEEKEEKPAVSSFLSHELKHDDPFTGARALRAAVVYESAGRQSWKIQRLLVPFKHPNLVKPAERPELFQRAAAERLESWLATFSDPAARARAGLEAAQLHNGLGRFDRAVDLCRTVEEAWPESRSAKHCARLRAEIELPALALTARFVPPGATDALTLHARNLAQVFLRLYKTTPGELERLTRARGQNPQDFSFLRHPNADTLDDFLSRRPDHAWTVSPRYAARHAHAQVPAETPPLSPGLWLAIASSDARFALRSSLVTAAIVNATDLFLVAAAGAEGPEALFRFDRQAPPARSAAIFHLYALDALTGKPRAASLDAFRRARWQGAERLALRADAAGLAGISAEVPLRFGEHYHASLDVLAQDGASWAYTAQPLYFSHAVPTPIEIHLETDRPIYRPGQEVRVKATVLERLPRGFRTYAGDSTLTLIARDANHRELHKVQLGLGKFGTASTRFTIPTGRLLGRYGLYGTLTDLGHGFHGHAQFSVEEYKRPEFEVTLEQASGAWKYGEKAEVKGKAAYYFGGPVPDAPVTWRVYRQTYIPWYCWYWFQKDNGRGARVEVASGQTKTDAEGRFSLSFVPEPHDTSRKEPFPSSFIVEAESRDAGGRTITDSRTYRAGAKAYLFSIEPAEGFFSAGKSAVVPIRLMNLNEQPQSGKGSFALHRLEGQPKDADIQGRWGGYFGNSPSLEEIFKDVPNGALAAKGDLSFSPKAPAHARLGALGEGVYRLTVRAADPWGGENEQSVILLTAGAGRTNLDLPLVAIAERASYLPGETARFLIGSSKLSGNLYVEIWGGNYILEKRALPQGGVQTLSVPVGRDHRGGFAVRWFGAKDFKIRASQAGVRVPWHDKELSVVAVHPKTVLPGAKTGGTLVVADRQGSPVDGEALLRVFDRSLEYYMAQATPWTSALYPPRSTYQPAALSLFSPDAVQVPVEEGWIKRMLELYYQAIRQPVAPALRLNRSRIYGGWGESLDFVSAARGMAMDANESPDMRQEAAPTAKRATHSAPAAEARMQGKTPEPAVAARKDFSETAYFEPHLQVAQGRASFRFRAPERLTDWKADGYVLTRDAANGVVGFSFATKKDLMVRVEMPRFYREGDEGVIKAIIHNETTNPLTGEVTLIVEENGAPADARLGLAELSRSFAVKPRGLTAMTWSLKAPRGRTTFKIRAVARSGLLVDAEERELPILPSRQRLIETVIAALDGTGKTELNIPAFFEKDETRVNESATLQIDPQLALSILNSLPLLVQYPHECTEQLLNRFVPLAIVNSFYRKHPALAEAVKRIPKRDTMTPAWERSDPRRLVELMETPWEEVSGGRKSAWPLIDLFDARLVKAQEADALGKLKDYQNGDGGWPWFPAGRSNAYMTLLVLAGFAEAQRYGVEVPLDQIARGLAYVNHEIPKHLKPEPGSLSLILYAAYVVTSFPKSAQGASHAWSFAKAWADYADTHSRAMTQLGKAYAAQVYRRLGENAKAELYLERAMDGVRQDKVAGAYWTPEKISWLWYTDTVETHAFMLRTLLALRPKDPRLPGLVQWLLFNRKGNEWKSTKASAAAIYSLLDVLKSRGALSQGERFTARWGSDAQTAQVEPLAWLDKPLRWTKIAEEVGPGHGAATIEKTGPGLSFASLTWIYTTEKPAKASGPGMLTLSRRFFRRVKEGTGYTLKPLKSGESVSVGEPIEVHLTVAARSQFEYVHLKDPKLAGFEAEALLSGWKWDGLSRYEEPRDSLTNFFMEWLPHGEYVLRYRLRPTVAGRFKLGAAVLQSMYAPEFAAHSDGFELAVTE